MTDEAPEGSGALGAPEAPDPDEAQRAIEYCYDQGWSDGLPLVPVSAPLLDRFDVKPGRLYQPLRVAITGTSVSPGIFESLATLGKEHTVERLKDASRRLSAES